MKIYCNRQDKNDLSRFVGQNIWVKVLIQVSDMLLDYDSYWVKIISESDGYYYMILLDFIWSDGSYFTRIGNVLKSRVISFPPFDVFTDDEMVDLGYDRKDLSI